MVRGLLWKKSKIPWSGEYRKNWSGTGKISGCIPVSCAHDRLCVRYVCGKREYDYFGKRRRDKIQTGRRSFWAKKQADATLLSAIETGEKADVKQYYLDEAKKKLDKKLPKKFKEKFDEKFPDKFKKEFDKNFRNSLRNLLTKNLKSSLSNRFRQNLRHLLRRSLIRNLNRVSMQHLSNSLMHSLQRR